MTLHALAVRRPVIDVSAQACLLRDREHRFTDLLAARTGLTDLRLPQCHLGVNLPHLLLQVVHRPNVQGAVAFAAVSADMDYRGNLNRLAAGETRVEELVGMRVGGRDAGPAGEAQADADSTVRTAVDFAAHRRHQRARAELLGGT